MQTQESGIFTATFSEDGLSYSNKTPLGITALVQMKLLAYSLDAVVMPNGLGRIDMNRTHLAKKCIQVEKLKKE